MWEETAKIGHAFIVVMGYIIEKYQREKWNDINMTVEDWISELSSVNSMEIQGDVVKYNQVPQAREIGSMKTPRYAFCKIPKGNPILQYSNIHEKETGT